MINIMIQNNQDNVNISKEIEEQIKDTIKTCLIYENFKLPCEIGVMIVNDEEMSRLNSKAMGINTPTDVLSFPIVEMKDGKFISALSNADMNDKYVILGDIVISAETVYKQSEEYGHSFQKELAFLVAHGLLHLLGYNDDDDENLNIMIEKQHNILKKMGLDFE